MNNDQLKQLIQNLGMMTELWTITFNGFKAQGMPIDQALIHTKAFMSTMMETFVTQSGGGNEQEAK